MKGLWGINLHIGVQDSELRRKLKMMTPQTTGQVLKKAISAISGPLTAAIKAATPVGKTGNLKKSIGQRVVAYRDGRIAIGFVGPRWHNRGRHGHLVEFGTKRRFTKAGENRGIAQPNPFLGPVFLAHKAELEAALTRSLKQQIEAFWSK